MKNQLNILTYLFSLIIGISANACKPATERSGVVVDSKTGEPIAGVSVEIYLKYQVKDSLQRKVSTGKDGSFYVAEKRPADQQFLLEKNGYIGFTSALPKAGDTIRMMKIEYYNE